MSLTTIRGLAILPRSRAAGHTRRSGALSLF